jgi:hypothetical protein
MGRNLKDLILHLNNRWSKVKVNWLKKKYYDNILRIGKSLILNNEE